LDDMDIHIADILFTLNGTSYNFGGWPTGHYLLPIPIPITSTVTGESIVVPASLPESDFYWKGRFELQWNILGTVK